MSGRRKQHREKNLTHRYLSGELEDLEKQHRFSDRSAGAEQRKIERTALLRAADEETTADVQSLPVGQVVQVYSLFYDVEHQGKLRLCVVRKTMARLNTAIVTGDFVRFRETGSLDEQGRPEAVIEELLPRKSLLVRPESFKGIDVQPLVANAEQVLIVTSLAEPYVKWGLVDRMLIAAEGGSLKPIVCLNKIDLADASKAAREARQEALEVMAHYQSIGIATLQTSAPANLGLEGLREVLRGRSTVLAGHSGVGKSSLIRAIQPALDIRVGAISGYTGKGRHTTTSARRYDLDFGGSVIDTPGVKQFGLWGVTRENLDEFFPDVAEERAPQWRVESYNRILESLPEGDE